MYIAAVMVYQKWSIKIKKTAVWLVLNFSDGMVCRSVSGSPSILYNIDITMGD